MLIDSSTFLAPESTFSKLRVVTSTTLPTSGTNDGDFVNLTQTDGANPAGLYWYNVDHWEGFSQSNVMARAGGLLSGFLTLHSDPTLAMHSATKQYVDNNTVNKLALAGGSLSGFLTLHADPTNSLHCATKQYVDAVASNLDPKQSCRAATTANIVLSGLQIVDGVQLTANDRVLVWKQTTTTQNGIYSAVSGAWARTDDATTGTISGGMFTFVEEGAENGDIGFVLTTDSPITIDATPIVFVQFAPLTTYAGAGLSQSGNTISADYIALSSSLAGTGLSASGSTLTVLKSFVPYDVGGYTVGKPSDGAVLMLFVVPVGRSFVLPTDLTNSSAKSLVAATAQTVYTLKKNGSTFATITFGIGATVGTFVAASPTTFSSDDVLTLHAPATADATHADLVWTFVPTLVS